MLKILSSLLLCICTLSVHATIEQTLSIIKPDALKRHQIGKITDRFEQHELQIVASKMIHLTEAQAKQFYIEHQGKPFYKELINFMISGPIIVNVLEGENAIAANRTIMGNTNPRQATPGTIRHDFAESTTRNSVHGSDSVQSAKREISFFFSQLELIHH